MNNEKLDISINNFLLSKGLLGYFKNIVYKKFSKYKLTYHGSRNSEILLFINNEFILRKDHFEQIWSIKNKLLELGYESLLITAKRRLSINKSDSLIDQFDKVYTDLNNPYKKVLVFCDSVPLQNYIINRFNVLDINTYSLQHGFYLEDSHKVFLKVYQSSNSQNFFVWDDRTLKNLKKHNLNRNYIKVGPHHKKHFKPTKYKKPVEKVAIFGCGKDQKFENIYLSKTYKSLLSKGCDVVFIGHPKFSLIDRIKFYFLNKVWVSRNKAKSKSYKLSLILNSSVFLELQENDNPYFMLNKHFLENRLPTNEELFKSNVAQDELLKPFLKKEESLDLIIKNLTNDL